jgi:predicted deacylase
MLDQEDLTIGGQTVAAGTKSVVRIPITTGLNGAELALSVHVLRGRADGPTLALLSGLHGGEWFSIETLCRLVAGTDPGALRGTLLVLPTINGPALALNTRNIPDESDSPDANRIFPGPLTWTSDLMIGTLCREVLPQATHLMDFHMGPWGSAFQDILVGADFPGPGVSDESERLALAYGSPIIRRSNALAGFPGPRSSIGYAGGVLGIPALGIETGGLGFGRRVEEGWHEASLDGVRAVMAAIGMIDYTRRRPLPKRQLVYRTSHRVNSRVGGLLRPRVGPDALGGPVERGALLGEVISPYTFEVVEELRAPANGLLFYVARNYPVHPGDWAFGVANTEDEAARWVENQEVRS